MQLISIAKLNPASVELNGSTLGQEHWKEIAKILKDSALDQDGVIVLDFDSVESATASYLKQVLNPLLGLIETPCENRYPVPVLINVHSADLETDLENFLTGRRRALIVAKPVKGVPKYQKILGTLDRAAQETLNELRKLRSATAVQLYERHRTETTNQTAWNNRLIQLVELRLARRTREGRFWIYEPAVNT